MRSLVVVHTPALVRLGAPDETEVTGKHEFCSSSRETATLLKSTWLLHDLCWTSQRHLAVHTATAMSVELIWDGLHQPFLAQQVRSLGRGMGHQRFLLREV